jgi:hypothetical protein
MVMCVGVLVCGCGGAPPQGGSALRELLGDSYVGAKITAIHDGNRVATIDLATLEFTDLASYPLVARFEGLSRPYWSPDGDRVVYSHAGKAYVSDGCGGGVRQILVDQASVYRPRFWHDPEELSLCVVFNDRNSKNGLTRGRYGNTLRTDLYTLRTEALFDLPCDSGPSLDGTHLGESYREAAVIDLKAERIHKLQAGQACNASMSPDNTYRLMFLYLPHTHFGIKNKYGRELWRIPKPEDSEEWQGPRWSTHPEFCCAVAKFDEGYKIVIIHIESQRSVVLRELPGNWQAPHMWLPGSGVTHVASLPRPRPGELLAAGQQELNTESAAALYEQLADQFPDSDAAQQAKATLGSKAFQDERDAQRLLNSLGALEDRLCPVIGVASRFSEPRFLARNRALLWRMTEAVLALRGGFSSTRSAASATQIKDRYGLPDILLGEAPAPVRLRVTVRAVSTVPTAEQIAPYREVITFIKCDVSHVMEGDYVESELVIALWGMKAGKHLPAARWRPGRELCLQLDLLDSHPELDGITRAADANDPSLPPYWVLADQSGE